MSVIRQRFPQIPTDDPRLHEGARLFNAGRYFESHEVWESLWHDVIGPEREMLQGLIQLAAGYHHLMQGNQVGAQYLIARARIHVAPWLASHAGWHVQQALDRAIEDLAGSGATRPSSISPSISF